jgi:hypothetical protein
MACDELDECGRSHRQRRPLTRTLHSVIQHLIFTACCFAVTACLTGCGHGELASLAGTVSYEGRPVEKGTITFLPADGKGPTAAAPITDGKYSVKVVYGRKVVKIEGFKVLGQHPFSPNNPRMVVDQQQIIPPCYNTKSELTREITPADGACDFALEKPPPAPARSK